MKQRAEKNPAGKSSNVPQGKRHYSQPRLVKRDKLHEITGSGPPPPIT